MMRITEVRTETEWRALEPIWNRLLLASGSGTTFLTWEWLTAWWQAYGVAGALRVLVAADGAGQVRGIAPLRHQSLGGFGRRYDVLAFIGDGSNDSDYLDFIIHAGFETDVIGGFLEHLEGALGGHLVLHLNEIPASSPNFAVLESTARQRYLWTQESVPCATTSLPNSWDGYLTQLKPRFRTKVRSTLRALEERRDVRFGFCNSQSEIDRLLPALYDLHTRRWATEGKPGIFVTDAKRCFYERLSSALLHAGSLRFSWLVWKDRVLACQYGFVYGTTYLHLQEGYEPAAEHWSVGLGLRAWTIREFINAGITHYDSLAGISRHKTDWGASAKESRRIVIAAPRLANTLLVRGPEWSERVKAVVKQVIPQQALARRRARAQARVRTAGRRDAGSRLRTLAARSYLRLGLPATFRRVRERYEVVPSAARGRTLARRTRPAGRILYYHRVSDEQDPFFPATSLAVFERHIKYLARHYTVVSLRTLLDHLDGGSPETLLAITFDDGYQDNYTNALPILERYGVPATIFLTTGGIDTREPMWFEVLSGVLKTTSREYLDLETDLPRRFWLRTLQDRLQANDALFGFLRRMPDQERTEWFARIVRELQTEPAFARPNMMLTWDQVRAMRQRGIEFGGHTVTHSFVSRLTRDRAEWEIGECKRRIEEELQASASHFAYPSGRAEDFAPENKAIAREVGYEAAVTTLWGLNYGETDRFELRRGGPWEEDEAMFAYKMDWYYLVNG